MSRLFCEVRILCLTLMFDTHVNVNKATSQCCVYLPTWAVSRDTLLLMTHFLASSPFLLLYVSLDVSIFEPDIFNSSVFTQGGAACFSICCAVRNNV